MNHKVEREYFVERIADYIRALEEHGHDLQRAEDNRLLFRVSGRPFEALAWIDAKFDLICITTRTDNFATFQFKEAVKTLKETLEICWEHCIAVSPVTLSAEENRYDLSMALFAGGCTFEAFEGVVYNLMACAEAIEENVKARKKKSKSG